MVARKPVLRAWLVGVILAVPLGAPAAGAAQDYAALGDSFTAGPLIPTQISPIGCLKSNNNYPHQAARNLGLSLTDRSCSGADTTDMTQSQDVFPVANPPQFGALSAATDYVTLGIGGNDIGFSSIVENCVSASPFGSPCRNRYVRDGVDEISARIQATAPKVAGVLQGIASRSPSARVLVVNYAAVFPETGVGCWPRMPVAWGDVPYLRSKQRELNAMLAAQAAAHGATLVDWYTASIGHDTCKSSGTRWVEPIVPGNSAAPVHPNRAGMTGAAALVSAAIGG